jgi:O-antigen/teichoic acid export membrane protein
VFFTTLILILFRGYIFEYIAKGIEFFPYILIGLLIVSINPVFGIVQTIHQAKQEANKYTKWNFAYFVVNASTILTALVVLNTGIIGLFVAQLFTTLLFGFASLFFIYRNYGFYFKLNELKVALKYAVPLVPHSLSGWTLDLVDRLFINNLKSTASVGIYNIGYSISQVLSFMVSAVHQAFNPWFMENLAKDEYSKKIPKVIELIISVYCLIALGISLFGKEILGLFIQKNFSEAWTVIPFISFSYVFVGLYYFMGYSIMFDVRKSKFINVPTFLSAIVSIILNIFLIPVWGIMGAGVSTLSTYFISSLISYFVAMRVGIMSISILKVYGTIFFYFMILAVLFLENQMGGFAFFGLKLMVISIILIFELLLKKTLLIELFKVIRFTK